MSLRTHLAHVLSIGALLGCTTVQVDDEPGGGGQGAGGDGAGAGGQNAGGDGQGGDGGSGGGVEPPQELFACSIPKSCDTISFHISAEPPDAPTCVAELAASGAPGAVQIDYVPGPYYSVSQHLVIYRGDGKAITQSRSKSCMSCDPETLLWGEPSDVELCDVVLPAEVVTGCQADDPETCWMLPDAHLENCVPIALPTCAEIDEILAGG